MESPGCPLPESAEKTRSAGHRTDAPFYWVLPKAPLSQKQSNRFREILHKRSGVFPSGKSGAKTGMAALQENAAQLLFSLHQRNAFASGIRCGSGCSNSLLHHRR